MKKKKNKPRNISLVRELRSKKVIVAMSGGVDSSVAAALLKEEGYDVIGIFMKFWAPFWASQRINADKKTNLRRYENRCCSSESEIRARKVADKLKIPFYVFDFRKEFKKKVVDYFLKEYKAGRTPNPCVVCNKEIKFGLLLKKALALDADYIATGHYARVKTQNSKLKTQNHNLKPKTFKLLKGVDKNKDQSYFLWKLNQRQLKHILFPVGNYTKEEVRELAKKFKLPVLNIPESQEICFSVNFRKNPGQIIDKKHKVIGKHQGLWFYTIGQRKGIKLSGGPYYVLDKDIKENILIVTKNEKDLYKEEISVKNISWISGKEPKFPLKVRAKIRYRHEPASAMIDKNRLVFTKPQRAITPGQSVVFYSGEELLGGGIII